MEVDLEKCLAREAVVELDGRRCSEREVAKNIRMSALRIADSVHGAHVPG